MARKFRLFFSPSCIRVRILGPRSRPRRTGEKWFDFLSPIFCLFFSQFVYLISRLDHEAVEEYGSYPFSHSLTRSLRPRKCPHKRKAPLFDPIFYSIPLRPVQTDDFSVKMAAIPFGPEFFPSYPFIKNAGRSGVSCLGRASPFFRKLFSSYVGLIFSCSPAARGVPARFSRQVWGT